MRSLASSQILVGGGSEDCGPDAAICQNSAISATVTSGGSTYYMKPAAGADQANGGALRGPQWKVLEFDLGKKKQKQRDEEAADAPAPPAAAK